jgi:uncharacterized RDD family membrane protein YckC
VEYEDVLTIRTPEGLEMEVPLAGLGSRFIASVVDLTLKGLIVTLLAVVLVPLLGITGVAITIAISFAVYVGYDILFEVARGGQTPGKKSAGIRVVRSLGRPVDLSSSAIRNVLRVVDGLPFAYIPGTISILVTKRNQRLGDLAAGTLVVREKRPEKKRPTWQSSEEQPTAEALLWDVSGVSAEDFGAIRQFLERRWQLDKASRERLALQLASATLPKVGGVQPGIDPEHFLAQVAAVKAARG